MAYVWLFKFFFFNSDTLRMGQLCTALSAGISADRRSVRLFEWCETSLNHWQRIKGFFRETWIIQFICLGPLISLCFSFIIICSHKNMPFIMWKQPLARHQGVWNTCWNNILLFHSIHRFECIEDHWLVVWCTLSSALTKDQISFFTWYQMWANCCNSHF